MATAVDRKENKIKLPEDHWLLGMKWQGRVNVNTSVFFMVCNSLLPFYSSGDTLEWVVKAWEYGEFGLF